VSYTFRLTQSGVIQPELIVGVKGENLLDDDVRNHVSFKKDEVLLPGQSVRAFGILRF
jgi:iron complex outermembrane receptor protein